MGVNSTVSKLNVGIEMAANIIIAVEFQFAMHEAAEGEDNFITAHCTGMQYWRICWERRMRRGKEGWKEGSEVFAEWICLATSPLELS